MFHCTLSQEGPDYVTALPLERQRDWDVHAVYMDALVEEGHIVLGGPIAEGPHVVLVIEADSAEQVRDILERDPWHGSHLVLEGVEPWTIRLDGRRRAAR